MQYGETIIDLLGTGELEKEAHEIEHDKSSTRVTDISDVPLHSAKQLRSLLSLAKSRKTVAATLTEYAANPDSIPTLLAVFLLLPPANAHHARIRTSLFGYREGIQRVGIPAKVRSTLSISLVRNDWRRAERGTTTIGRRKCGMSTGA